MVALRTLFVLFSLQFGKTGICQEYRTDFREFQLKHTCFIARDTSYELTRKTASTGSFCFYREFLTPDSFLTDVVAMSFNEGENVLIEDVFSLDNGVDTIRSYYDISDYPQPMLREGRHSRYVEDALTTDVSHANLLRSFGVVVLDTSAAYCLSPVLERTTLTGHRLMIIESWRSDSAMISCFEKSISPLLPVTQLCSDRPWPKKPRVRFYHNIFNALIQQDTQACVINGDKEATTLVFVGGKRFYIQENGFRGHREFLDVFYTFENLWKRIP